MDVLDSPRVVRERTTQRTKLREGLASVDATTASLAKAAPSAPASGAAQQRDYSNTSVINEVLRAANETVKGIAASQQQIAKLEVDLKSAQSAATKQRIMMVVVAAVVLIGIFFALTKN